MATIVTKNSSTASAVPTTSDLVQGELAVNVTDKRIFTENASTAIVELGTNPSSLTTTTATVTGTLTANGTFASSNAVITGGSVNGVIIGASSPLAITGSLITANTGFAGGLTGDVTGNVTGNLTGNVTGNVTGDLTGNVTATSVLADGVTATTQTAGDNSTKVATTAYVDSISVDDDLNFGGDTGSGTVDLDTQTFTVAGTTYEIETSATGQTLTIGLPSSITVDVVGALTGNASTATTLETARTIAGVSFDGSANIDIPIDN